jgi:hypothetical protein
MQIRSFSLCSFLCILLLLCFSKVRCLHQHFVHQYHLLVLLFNSELNFRFHADMKQDVKLQFHLFLVFREETGRQNILNQASRTDE